MSTNRGKQWEVKVREDFMRTFPDGTIDRLYDPVGGYVGIKNICDFIAFYKKNIFYLEVKSKDGNTFPFANLTQYDKLIKKVGIPGVRTGVILWFKDHDIALYVPIKIITEMKKAGKKSLNIKDISNYNIYKLPSIKKRVFLECDYSLLADLQDGE